jgi:hypothetical protein
VSDLISLDATYIAGPIPIQSGVPFPVRADFLLLLSQDLLEAAAAPATCGARLCFYSSGGLVDFAHTADLVGIEVRDATGQLVSDFTLATESGATYGVAGPGPGPGASVPLPATLWLLAMGAAALASGRRSRRGAGALAVLASVVTAGAGGPARRAGDVPASPRG